MAIGRLDESEFIAGVAHIGVASVGAAQARDEFYGLAERNGHVLFHEFCSWCFEHHVAEEGYVGQEEQSVAAAEADADAATRATAVPSSAAALAAGDHAETQVEPTAGRLVGRKTPEGVWVGSGAPTALHDELAGMEERKLQLRREIDEMEEAQAQQLAHMVEQRSSLKSSMDAMVRLPPCACLLAPSEWCTGLIRNLFSEQDLQKTAAETAANGAAKVAAAFTAAHNPPTTRQVSYPHLILTSSS